jgi:hypothetical protein
MPSENIGAIQLSDLSLLDGLTVWFAFVGGITIGCMIALALIWKVIERRLTKALKESIDQKFLDWRERLAYAYGSSKWPMYSVFLKNKPG